jgi:hypothetical protein
MNHTKPNTTSQWSNRKYSTDTLDFEERKLGGRHCIIYIMDSSIVSCIQVQQFIEARRTTPCSQIKKRVWFSGVVYMIKFCSNILYKECEP